MRLTNPEASWPRERPTIDTLALDPRWRAAGAPAPGTAGVTFEVLGGGQANACVRVRTADADRVLKIGLRDPDALAVEAALLARPWRTFAVPAVRGVVAGALWLDHVPHGEVPADREAGLAVGRALAEIHVPYPTAGWLGADLRVREPLSDPFAALRDHLATRSLPGELAARVLSRWDTDRDGVRAVSPVLLHGDFKPANLGWADAGLLVLDWEFAYAGPALLDLGQLLRWDPPTAFVAGVEEGLGTPVDRRLAATFDLVNLCDLLERAEAGGRRARDVTERIAQTLGHGPGIRPADTQDLEWVNARYREIAFRLSDPADLVLVATWEGARVGAGRVVPVDGSTGELGGMYVDPAFRGRDIAARLVRELQERTSAVVLFCIPFAHLAALYERAGFREVGPGEEVPAAVAEKLAWCGRTYPDPVRLLRWGVDPAVSLRVERLDNPTG